MVASLLDPVEAHKSENPGLGNHDWQFLLGLMVVTVCCWEVAKILGSKFWKGCQGVIAWFCQREALGSNSTAEVRVARYIDDVVVIGPREAVAQFNRERTEETTALEGPGAPSTALEVEGPRRRSRRPVFQFNPRDHDDWPSPMSLTVTLVGQDRFEHRPQWRSLIRWHVEARVRLFNPENTKSPVAVRMLTGRRRTWIFDATEVAPNGRRMHADNWRVVQDKQETLPYSWVGCTEFETFLL